MVSRNATETGFAKLSPAQFLQQFSSAWLRLALLSVLDHPTPHLGQEFYEDSINPFVKVEVLPNDILLTLSEIAQDLILSNFSSLQ